MENTLKSNCNNPSSSFNEDDGTISITNGQVIITDPKSENGKKAQIGPCTVKVLVNGKLINSLVEVTSNDKITFILPPPKPKNYDKQIIYTQDKLEARLKIFNKHGEQTFVLRDYPPSNKIIVNATLKEEPYEYDTEVENDLLNFIKQQGIVYGFDSSKLKEAFEKAPEPVLIAKGVPPIPTIDDELIYHFEPPKLDIDFDTVGKIDYFEMHPLPIVHYGDLLLTKKVGKKGKPGINVFGKEIPVRDPIKKDYIPAMDGSVSIGDNGLTVKAGISGIPSWDGVNIKVKPVYVVEGDADVNTTGNIDFPGTVIVKGSTLDNIHIWATQNIEVHKDVIFSVLDAEESIRVNGRVIRSKLIAGGEAAAGMKVLPFVENIKDIMSKTILAFNDLLKSAPHLRNFAEDRIIIELLKTIAPSLREDIDELWNLMDSLKRLNYKDMLSIKAVLANLLNLHQRKVNREEFNKWITQLSEVIEKLKAFQAVTYDIYIAYSQMSNIATSGTIFVTKEGAYNSHFLAGNDILISGSPGYFREGSIKAKGNVFVKELGSPNSSITTVEVPADKKIGANLVHPGVILKIGDQEYRFLEKFYKLEAHLDKEGKIRLTK